MKRNNGYDARAKEIINAARNDAISEDDAEWLREYIIALGHLADSYARNWSRAERRIAQMQEIIELECITAEDSNE